MDAVLFVNVLFLVFLAIFAWKKYYSYTMVKKIPSYLNKGAMIIDVRTPEEFSEGASSNSVNIPLDEIEKRLNALDRQKPVIVCCRSGYRSMLAAKILKKNGFRDVLDGGAWTNIS